MMKLKPSRTELLDAITLRIFDKKTQRYQDLKEARERCQKDQRELEIQKEQSQLNMSEYDGLVKELETAVNAILEVRGFSQVTFAVQSERYYDNESNENRFRPLIDVVNCSRGKPVKKKSTKVLDRKIQEHRDRYAELNREVNQAYQEASAWQYPSKHTRARIMSKVMESDSTVVDAIEKAARAVVVDEAIVTEFA